MTIVKSDAGDDIAQRPPKGVALFLLHGSDQGLIHERASRLVKALAKQASQASNLVRMDGEALSREHSALRNESDAVDMFGGSKVIWIDGNQRDLTAALNPIFEAPPPDCSIVLEAGSLKKGSSMRVLFEQSAVAASIECYPDERRSLQAIVETEAREANLTLTAEAQSYLISLLGSDRLTSRGEVSKLMIYCQGKQQIEIGDVEAIVSDAAPSSADKLIESTLLGNLSNVETLASRYFAEDGDAAFIVSKLISNIEMLHQLKISPPSGKPFDSSLPAGFFRLSPSQRTLLTEQAKRWKGPALQQRLLWAREVLARIRIRPAAARAVATRALWALASSARAQQR